MIRTVPAVASSRQFVVAALAACVALVAPMPSPRAAGAQQAPEGFPAEGQPASVTLISNGSAPRTALRYTPAAGETTRMEMTVSMSMAMDMGGMAMPPMQMPLMKMGADVTVTDVAASGDIGYQITFTDSSVEATPGVDPMIVSALEGMDASIKGLRGTGTMSDRGVARDVEIDYSQLKDPQIQQAVGSMVSSVEQLSMPLPEEPVGVGARWEVRQRLAPNDMLTFQKFDVEVTAIEGDVVTLKATMEQSAPRQAVNNPSLPPDAQVYLQRLTGSGSGTSTITLTSLVPASEMSARSNAVMEISMGGASQTMGVETTMKMTVRR